MCSTRACGASPEPVPQTAKIFIRLLLFPLGMALLTAAFLFQGGTALSTSPQSMPTPDRLAQPTLPSSPSLADYGAQEFWFQCLPCHGDRGQGLTDEFRETYPPEDRNCWASKCHGDRPYENGWTIPPTVPAVIGANTITKFPNAKTLHDFICAAMPYQWPGTLDDETCWKLTAFLLRENRIAYREGQLNASDAGQVLLLPVAPTPTPGFVPAEPVEGNQIIWPVLLSIFLLGGILFLWHTLGRNRT